MTTAEYLVASPARRHAETHYPEYNGRKLEAEPFVRFPLAKNEVTFKKGLFDLRRLAFPSEGFIYSDAERDTHGHPIHGAMDVAVPMRTKVYAPFDGIITASFHSVRLLDKNGNHVHYQGKPLWWGLGKFVQFYDKRINRFLQLGHLDEIDDRIPFSSPTNESNPLDWVPTRHNLTKQELLNPGKGNGAFITHVGRGEFLGYSGNSGLGWGAPDYDHGQFGRQYRGKYTTWDEPHIHMEEFDRDQETGYKYDNQRDIFAVYSTFEDYQDVDGRLQFGPDPLMLLDGNENPEFAR